ncbi:MAG TPA: DNA repair protein RecN [Dehalococcoidia bacterium]|nr:DNA repair protein RecN [Dehalococcoidia bacterium]
MLLELRVRDIGIIEDINWNLGPGFNVITGETGAGKSLVIDAVEALLGGKPDEEMIRHGANEAQIEGVFSLAPDKEYAGLREVLAEKGLATDEDTLVIYCELRRQGRSIIRVNGQAVPRGLLQQIGSLLIDVHGQSQHLSLLDSRSHLDFLDAYSHTLEMRQAFTSMAAELNKAEQELKSLTRDEQELARREEYLRYQVDEIDRAELYDGEDEELEQEQKVLASAEHLKASSFEVYRQLYGDDSSGQPSSALDRLHEAVAMMKRLVETDPGLKTQLESLEEALYSLEETTKDIRTYSDRLEYDPARLAEVESRLELIKDFKRKYGQSITEILNYGKEAAVELEGISHSSERRLELEENCTHIKQEMGQLAAQLSEARTRATAQLKKSVEKELQDLNMPQVQFEVAISRSPDPEGIPYPDGQSYAFTNDGADIVEFLASTNPGEPIKPLARIASTGETSRFMLALKGVLSEADSIPVLVFDEIDIGVGGRSAEVIGKKLWTLARHHQTICVTHLPQITAFADAHYRVQKEVSGDRTVSRLEVLAGDARTEEMAAMLAGSQITETSLKNARELMESAEGWKGSGN